MVQRSCRRSRRGLAGAAAVGGDGAQRDGREQPAAGGRGRTRRPPPRWQRDRCGGHDGRGVECRRTDERRTWWRPLCDRLHRIREQVVCARCQREGAHRADARAHERRRLRVEFHGLGARIRHAIERSPHGDRAGIRLGLGRGAAPLWHHDVQGDAAACHRLRRTGISDFRAHRIGLDPSAGSDAESRRPARMLYRDRSRFDRRLVRRGAAAGGRHNPPESRPREVVSHPPGARRRRILRG